MVRIFTTVIPGLSLAFALVFLSDGCSKDSPIATENPSRPSAPQAPSNLHASGITVSSISLAWDDNSDNETGFHVERRLGGATDFQLLATLPQNTTGLSDTGLSGSTSYEYRARAFNSVGPSDYCTSLSVTTQAPPAIYFPASPGSSWTYSVDKTYGFISYYGSSNTHLLADDVLYVLENLLWQGRSASSLLHFTVGVSPDTTFDMKRVYVASGAGTLERYTASGWKKILSGSSTTLYDNVFLLANGPGNDGPTLVSSASITVPAGTFQTTRAEFHFKQNGQYDTHHIYEDGWEDYADGVGLVRSQWNYSDDDKDPMGADMWNRGTLLLKAGNIPVTKEAEPNDSPALNPTALTELPALAFGDADLLDGGQIVAHSGVNANKNNEKRINDWYRFYVSQTRDVIINLQLEGSTNDLDLYLFRDLGAGSDTASLPLYASSFRPEGCKELIHRTLPGSSYYLLGVQAWNTPGSRTPYWLSVR